MQVFLLFLRTASEFILNSWAIKHPFLLWRTADISISLNLFKQNNKNLNYQNNTTNTYHSQSNRIHIILTNKNITLISKNQSNNKWMNHKESKFNYCFYKIRNSFLVRSQQNIQNQNSNIKQPGWNILKHWEIVQEHYPKRL